MTTNNKARTVPPVASLKTCHCKADCICTGESLPSNRAMIERMARCPKWEQCSAPICPVDSNWQSRTMQNDEAVCYYLSEHTKEGAEARFQGAGLAHLYREIAEVLPAIVAKHSRIRRALERSAQTGARMDSRFRSSGDAGSE